VTADQVIERVKLWRAHNYGHLLPEATVLADRDWLAYVQAMAAAVPVSEQLMFPTEEDVEWAWPAGVTIVFGEPVPIDHVIVSEGMPGIGRRKLSPHTEEQTAAGVLFFPLQLVGVELADEPATDSRTYTEAFHPEEERAKINATGEMAAIPLMWIATDPTDIVTGHWVPGSPMRASQGATIGVGQSARLQLAIITALGHRLTRITEPVTANRGERRRVHRDLPGLRMLQLATGASVTRSEGTGTVEWSHRWMVRGHWRLQPYGPQRTLRRAQWIDPYVKGPEDKPLDVRPTIWRAHAEGGS